jgi:putative hydrolase of the HAD superfamily
VAEISLAETVVVLDLDDTLYPEADYQDSGLRAVCGLVAKLYGKAPSAEQALARRPDDPLGAICEIAEVPDSVKSSLLWMYRLHTPDISLAPRVAAAIYELSARAKAVVILTDGRSVTQRLKLQALGLAHLRTYISEEFASEKPDPHRFECIMRDLPAQAYVYVADNPAKDFIAPRALGWDTVGVRGNSRNVHRQDSREWPPEQLPKVWINSLPELSELLC